MAVYWWVGWAGGREVGVAGKYGKSGKVLAGWRLRVAKIAGTSMLILLFFSQ